MSFREQTAAYSIVFSPRFEKIIKSLKKRKPDVFKSLKSQFFKIAKEPALGKPLRNILRNYRRVHIGSFVLIYEIYNQEIRFLDFDHHDRIYKKY